MINHFQLLCTKSFQPKSLFGLTDSHESALNFFSFFLLTNLLNLKGSIIKGKPKSYLFNKVQLLQNLLLWVQMEEIALFTLLNVKTEQKYWSSVNHINLSFVCGNNLPQTPQSVPYSTICLYFKLAILVLLLKKNQNFLITQSATPWQMAVEMSFAEFGQV